MEIKAIAEVLIGLPKSYINRDSKSCVFNSGQKMALRAVYIQGDPPNFAGWVFLKFLHHCICKDIKLKIGIDDHQLLHHDIIKAKNNDSIIVSVMIILIVMSTRYAIKCGQSSRFMNLICSISYGLKTCISALKRSTNCQDYSTSHCGGSKGNKWHGVSNLKRKSCSQMVFQFFRYPFGGAIFQKTVNFQKNAFSQI